MRATGVSVFLLWWRSCSYSSPVTRRSTFFVFLFIGFSLNTFFWECHTLARQKSPDQLWPGRVVKNHAQAFCSGYAFHRAEKSATALGRISDFPT